jgi:hypothetical protein
MKWMSMPLAGMNRPTPSLVRAAMTALPYLEHEGPRIDQPHPLRPLVQFVHAQTMAEEGR